MKIKLGTTTVTAISDGGLSLYPKPSSSIHIPILCMEVPPARFRVLCISLICVGQTTEVCTIEPFVNGLCPRRPNLRSNARNGV